LGALLFSFRFCRDFGLWEGLYYSIFHAISAFCNAGFDLMGRFGPFSSLTPYAGDPLITLTAAALVLIGGLGFLVWTDLLRYKHHWSRYSLHTRIALTASLFLVAIPTLLFYCYERNALLTGLSGPQALLRAFFAAVSPRTAGFNTIDMGTMTTGSYLLTAVLMMIGGNPGSTAGGIKITTFVVAIFPPIPAARRSRSMVIGGKALDDSVQKEAMSTLVAYLILPVCGCLILAGFEPFSLTEILLEVISAVATVGLTTGITSSLSSVSHLTLILLMFAGRVGVMTLAVAFGERRNPPPLRRPTDRILIG
jgi:trk system potassium uptake protein TrkH